MQLIPFTMYVQQGQAAVSLCVGIFQAALQIELLL